MIERYKSHYIESIWSKRSVLTEWVWWEAILPVVYHNNLSTRIDEMLDQVSYVELEKLSDEIEKECEHDVAAFVQALQQICRRMGYPDELVDQIHRYPITSSDIVDNAMMSLIARSASHILGGLTTLMDSLAGVINSASGHTNSRTHGQIATQIPVGLRWIQHHTELKRCYANLEEVIGLLPAKIGGLDGSHQITEEQFSALNRFIPHRIAMINCTQVIPRDCHARIANELSVVSSTVARLALSVRLLSQSGINEVAEPKSKHYKGSSVMPHKHNPTISENVSGMARLARAYAGAISENVELWLERDISHSCVERVAFPDLFHVVAYQLERMNHVVSGMILAQDIPLIPDSAKRLEELIRSGMQRDDAYRQVQEELK